MSLSRMTKDELKEFVLGFADGRIFSTAHMHESQIEHNLAMVFMPLALGAVSGMSETDSKDIGIIWEWLKEAGPRSINGMPCFFSCRIMHKDDWELARKAINKELDRRQAIDLDLEENESGKSDDQHSSVRAASEDDSEPA